MTLARAVNLSLPSDLADLSSRPLHPTVYACSLLSSLNARESLRGELMETWSWLKTGSAPMPSFPRFAALPFSLGTFASLGTAANGYVVDPGCISLPASPRCLVYYAHTVLRRRTHTHIQVHAEQNATVPSHPVQSIGEQPRIRSRPSYEASPSHHDSESFSPSIKGFGAQSSDPVLAV